MESPRVDVDTYAGVILLACVLGLLGGIGAIVFAIWLWG